MGEQTKLDFGFKKLPKSADVPFVNEVEIFNGTFGKPNNYETTTTTIKGDTMDNMTIIAVVSIFTAGITIAIGVIGLLLGRTRTSEPEEENMELLPPPASV